MVLVLVFISILGDDYQFLHAIGEGAYRTVAAALLKPSGRQVAIKKVLPFDHTLFCLRTLRELKLLKLFSDTCVNENASQTKVMIFRSAKLNVLCRSSLSWISSSRLIPWSRSRKSTASISSTPYPIQHSDSSRKS